MGHLQKTLIQAPLIYRLELGVVTFPSFGDARVGDWTALSQAPVSGLTYISCVCERVCKHASKFVLAFVCEVDDSTFFQFNFALEV